MSYSIQCVHCQAILKSPTPVPGGKTVKCPKCKQAFVTPEAAPPPEPPPAPEPEPAPEPPSPAIPNMEIPEVDDDLVAPDDGLVEPDDEEIVETDVEEEIEEEETKPKTKKKRKDEDDEPRSRKKKRKDEDEDDDEEDEAPRSKKHRKDDDDDEEEDDEPRPKKKRKDDDEDNAPKKGKKKKAGSSRTLLLMLLGGGGILGLCMCCTCGSGGYFYWSKPLVGRWEPADGRGLGNTKVYVEFGYFGTGRHHIEGPDPFTNKQESTTVHFSYSTSGRNPIVLEQALTSVESTNNDAKNLFVELTRKEIGKVHRNHVTFDGDIMIITSQERNRSSMRWRRAR
jgi:DNA mismatch repair ATPase MutL/phage FluMu protein Com